MTRLLPLCILLGAIGCQPSRGRTSPQVEAPFRGSERQLRVFSATIPWKPCPANLPPQCRMAVLEGDPTGEQLYTLRLVSDAPIRLPRHSHPQNERVTVLWGKLFVDFGDEHVGFTAGDYYVNRAGVAHSVWSEGPVSIQITGMGPWVALPVPAKSSSRDR